MIPKTPKLLPKCLNCKEKPQRSYSNFCCFECGREYMRLDEEDPLESTYEGNKDIEEGEDKRKIRFRDKI